MPRQVVIQDSYWMGCLRDESPVNVMLMTGDTMPNWVVRRFDRYCVVFETPEGKENLVFKSGILMVEPVGHRPNGHRPTGHRQYRLRGDGREPRSRGGER